MTSLPSLLVDDREDTPTLSSLLQRHVVSRIVMIVRRSIVVCCDVVPVVASLLFIL